jgi:hypothetical protein
MKKSHYIGWMIALIVLLPTVGYGLMHFLIYVFPMSETSTWSHIIYTVILIALGLTIPYFMLKALFSAAHRQNPRDEHELHLKDLPKDKDDLVSDFQHHAR